MVGSAMSVLRITDAVTWAVRMLPGLIEALITLSWETPGSLCCNDCDVKVLYLASARYATIKPGPLTRAL